MRPDGLDARHAYDAWHQLYEVDAKNDTPWHALVRRNLDPDRDLKRKKVLEIGSGRGDFSCWLAGERMRPEQIVAADFSKAALMKGQAFAVSRGLGGIDWAVADIQAIPHPEATFDTVISCETVEHVPAPSKAVAELARVLKPGGRLLLTTPNYLSTMGVYRAYMRLTGRRYTETGQPINHFVSLPLTLWWIRLAGLHIQKVDAQGHYLPFPRRQPIRIGFLERPRALMKWVALHSFVAAEKPRA